MTDEKSKAILNLALNTFHKLVVAERRAEVLERELNGIVLSIPAEHVGEYHRITNEMLAVQAAKTEREDSRPENRNPINAIIDTLLSL